MLAYDELHSFRSPPKTRVAPSRGPARIEALDDLHRTLYGSLHPSAELTRADRDLVEVGEDGESKESWLEQHAMSAAIGVVAVLALYTWMRKPKEPPLQGPADVAPASSL